MTVLFRAGVICLLELLAFACVSQAATITVSFDQWMYPFAFTGGTRDLAPTFGAVDSPGFDNRDGEFLIAFNTSAEIPTGLGAQQYQINSVTVRAMVGSPSGFEYDPTYDSFRTYLPVADPNALVDSDAGRPIELHGLGFRNGYTQLSFGANDNQPPAFEESSPFGPQDQRTRNVYPLGFLAPGVGTDIANNVSDGTESNPWALGTTSLAPGAAVPDNSTFSFALDIANADVRSYLQQGLNDGTLGFAITSIHSAAQTGGPPVPQFITKENTRAGASPAVLEIDYQVVPEPATAGLLASGLFAVLFVHWRRRFKK